ncbi:hypothetical protein QR680_008312 [Steinernema hermaphroditum]|uniref:Uncharacterized protein n=1 Tax=Steinernema hermaphroditum TaxID=289476 RepID=A0AA39M7V9_9BILA|nr:hypothetical protein QR680_008312 [Steinernema hermaphroditum]
MVFNMYLNLSYDRPKYLFSSDTQELATLPPGQNINLDLLLIDERPVQEAIFFPLHQLDTTVTYHFKRLDIDTLQKELDFFPRCISTNFEEISLKDVCIDGANSVSLLTTMFRSGSLKSLKLEDVELRRCSEPIIDFLQRGRWETFAWVTNHDGTGDHCRDYCARFHLSDVIKTWRDNPNPVLKQFRFGGFVDEYEWDLKRELCREFGRNTDKIWTVAHSSARLVANVDFQSGILDVDVEPMKDVKYLTEDELKAMTKESLIEVVKQLQRRVP